MFPAFLRGMNPIVASGAASLAGVLINKAVGQASSAQGNVALDPKEFERALNKAAGVKGRQAAGQQAADLRQRLMQRPELEAAIYSQPAGSVSGVEVRADGSLSLRTSNGPVSVQLGAASRELAQSLYAVSAVQGVAGSAAPTSATQAPLLLPLQGVQGGALR
jgi:hypothetical protein